MPTKVKRRISHVAAPTQKRRRKTKKLSPAVRLHRRKLAAKRKARLLKADHKFNKVRGKILHKRRTKGKKGKHKFLSSIMGKRAPGSSESVKSVAGKAASETKKTMAPPSKGMNKASSQNLKTIAHQSSAVTKKTFKKPGVVSRVVTAVKKVFKK